MNETLCNDFYNNSGLLEYYDPHRALTYQDTLNQLSSAMIDKFAIFGAVLIIAGAWHMSKYSQTVWIVDGDFNLTEFITGMVDMMAFGAGVAGIAYYMIAKGMITL